MEYLRLLASCCSGTSGLHVMSSVWDERTTRDAEVLFTMCAEETFEAVRFSESLCCRDGGVSATACASSSSGVNVVRLRYTFEKLENGDDDRVLWNARLRPMCASSASASSTRCDFWGACGACLTRVLLLRVLGVEECS